MKDSGIFIIQARKCLRCGRLLTSHEAIVKGYGCQCEKKARCEEEEKEPIHGQIRIEDLLGEETVNEMVDEKGT